VKTVAVAERARTLTDAMPDEVLARIADRAHLTPMLSGASSLRSRGREGTLVVRTPDDDIEVSAPAALLDQVFSMCDGTRTIGEILDTAATATGRSDLAQFMDFLLDQGALIDANLASAAAARYGFQFSPVGLAAELSLTDQICRRFRLQKGASAMAHGSGATTVAPGPLAPLFETRLSTHTFDDRALDPQTLDQLLWSLAGVVHLQHPRLGQGVPHRTVASAGGMYLVEVFVALRRGIGAHAPGVYRVRYPGERVVALEPVGRSDRGEGGDPMHIGHDLLPTAFTKPWELAHAAGAVFLAADPSVAALRYRSRSLQYLFMEAGAVLHNGALSADALGLGYATIGGYYEEPIGRMCRLERQLVLGAAIFGARPTADQLAMASKAPKFDFAWSPRKTERFALGFHLARVSVVSDSGPREDAWGRDPDPWLAVTKAVAEAIERQGMHEPRALVDGRLHEVAGAIDPRRFVAHGASGSTQPGVDAVGFDERRTHAWTTGIDLVTGESVRVLAALVYTCSSLETCGRPTGPGGLSLNSSGCAAGLTREDAIWRGLLEVAERDAFMRHWLAQTPGETVEVDPRRRAMRTIAERVAALRAAGCRVSLQRLPSAWAHVALVSAQHAQQHFTTVGSAASMDMVDALAKALDELEARVHAWLSGHVPDVEGPADVVGPEHHFDLYGLKKFFRRADRVLFPDPADTVVPFPRALRWRGVDQLVVRFAREGIHPVAVDITPRQHHVDQGRTPLTAVKVLVPGLQPMSFGPPREPRGRVPRAHRGWKFPHPFP